MQWADDRKAEGSADQSDCGKVELRKTEAAAVSRPGGVFLLVCVSHGQQLGNTGVTLSSKLRHPIRSCLYGTPFSQGRSILAVHFNGEGLHQSLVDFYPTRMPTVEPGVFFGNFEPKGLIAVLSSDQTFGYFRCFVLRVVVL